LYGSFDSAVAIAQVLVTAANVNPPPMAAATHLSLGTATLPTTEDSTMELGYEPHLTFEFPTRFAALDGEAAALPVREAVVKDQPGVQARIMQQCRCFRRTLA
jgi:hypothetical protein